MALDGRQSTMWMATPAIVTSVNLVAMTLEAQPAIQGTIEDENGNLTFVNLPLLVDVPIHFPGGGGFVFTSPIAVNDEVLIIFASRCIDAWWQSGGVQKPMEARMHDLSDGFAIPKVYSQPNVIPNISTTGAQLRNLAGTTYVEISGSGNLKLVSTTEIDITAPTVSITGALNVSGDINGDGVDLKTHEHAATGLTAPSGGGAVTGHTGQPL